MRNSLYIVDVFAEKKYQGNQLAVIHCKETLSDAKMQRLANEMHFSETTYILSEKKRKGGYDVRIFTPQTEVPFAGHPTLGTAYILQSEFIRQPIDRIALNLKIGQIEVELTYKKDRLNLLWMRQINPIFSQIINPDSLSRILNLNREEIDDKFPIQEVSTGLPFIIVPLKTLNALQNIEIARDRYFELIRNIQAKALMFFCPQTCNPGNDLHARVFTYYYGIPEDPASGSANGCLAGYLIKHRYYGKPEIDIRVEQGYEIGRPSLLYLRAREKEDSIDISVGGKVVLVARGEIS
jgi:trans-2,3-dihydro-3-hydroxyanthranilate isomerase